MFNNPGNKLKGIAKAIFVLIILLYLLLAVSAYVTLIEESSTSGNGVLFAIFILLGLAIGALVGWLSSIILYAFGELIEDTHATQKALKRIDYKLTKIAKIQGISDASYLEDDEEDDE